MALKASIVGAHIWVTPKVSGAAKQVERKEIELDVAPMSLNVHIISHRSCLLSKKNTFSVLKRFA